MIPENEVPKIKEVVVDETRSKFIIDPLLPGYGATMGNALRRVLLSSLPGTAISSIKLEGIAHEFSAIPHVKEDMIKIIMNLRKINFKSYSDEPVTINLTAKGPKSISAKDFKLPSSVEILNPDEYIATLDKSADFDLEVVLEQGRGFRPTEDREIEKNDVGRISIDSVFSPVKLINFKIEHTRVGQMTNYDKIELEIVTNGSISPREALTQAGKILVQHFNYIAEGKPYTSEEEVAETVAEAEPREIVSLAEVDPKTKVVELNLSARTINALINSGIKTVAGLKRLSDLKLSEVKGLGKKGFEEVKELLAK